MPSEVVLPRLILLGCGYLGRALAVEARHRGWTVEALTRNPAKARTLREELKVGVVESDLASNAWHSVFDPQGSWVIDCVSSGGGGIDGYRESYRRGAESIVRWMRQRGAPVGLIYTGSTSVYPQTEGVWVDESSEARATTPLNEILLQTEGIFRQAVAEGLVSRAALLRLAGIYGPSRHYLIDRIREGHRDFPGRGDYALNLIHRDDAVSAILSLIERWQGVGAAIFNVADGRPASKETIAQWTADALGKLPPIFHPGRASERSSRRLLAAGNVPDRRIRADKLRKATGWTPRYTDFRAGYQALLHSKDDDGEPAF